MSVIVKGMEMPEYCIDCYFYASNSRNDSCLLLKRTLGGKGDREEDCPLEEAFDHELLQHVEYTSEQLGYDK